LVIQYQEGEALSLNQNLSDNIFTAQNPPAEGARGGFVASMGKLLALNFDVVTAFGVQFALSLNLDLSEDRARVLADTTLNGISEEEIRFQNTSTYRYREYETDPNTGELRPTGIVREISSGLKLTIKGWVSGDNMITMEVDAEVSKRGADVSADTGKPPTTYEKLIKTNVRTPVGEPVVIGGLIEEDTETIVQKIPVLGDIPILGILFRSQKDSVNKTEFVIYIVPHVDLWEQEEAGIKSTLERLYHKFFS
ncbi:MAG: type II and III secretion system protein, partial [Spirochaetes bacterium]|nr:type II and III secretion system protein [Spirochaetota bacterium]